MKKLFCLVALALFISTTGVSAQTAITGIIERVTLDRITLSSGQSYRRASNATAVTLSDQQRGQWGDLKVGDAVQLELNTGQRITSAVITGKREGERVERLLVNVRPTEGRWHETKEGVTIAGRVFDNSGLLRVGRNETSRVVYSNRDDNDLFEAWVGYQGGKTSYGYKIRFVVQGDGQVLFTSPWMGQEDAPIKISVDIKGDTGVSLVAEGDKQGSDSFRRLGVWADPKFIKLIPVIIPIPPSPDVATDFPAPSRMTVIRRGGTISVLLNDQPIHFAGSEPMQQGGRVLVPLRDIFEALGATISFDPTSGAILATQNNKRVALTLNSNQATIDGQPVTLDVPAQAVLGRTMVPLRFVSEALGVTVTTQ